jgi:hypothetical protein
VKRAPRSKALRLLPYEPLRQKTFAWRPLVTKNICPSSRLSKLFCHLPLFVKNSSNDDISKAQAALILRLTPCLSRTAIEKRLQT